MMTPNRALLTHYLRQMVTPQRLTGPTDVQLLERVVACGDAAAFQVLLVRYAPLVLGVCRRVLRHEQDAEDAFQVTFLMLLQKAGSIGRPEAMASWLHRVAFRVALRAKGLADKRAAQSSAEDVAADEVVPDLVWRDLRPVLDEEVERLPAKYRTAFILCYLRGLSNEEAAAQLGCPKGTVQSRLAWARQRLKARLTRRGLAPACALLAAALARKCDAASVPPALVHSLEATVRFLRAGATVADVASWRVAALTQGALQAMLWTKIKVVLICVLAVGLLGASGVVGWQVLAALAASATLPNGSEVGHDQPGKGQAQPPGEANRFTFEMRDQPWSKVFEWYSEASGLPLVTAHKPTGTFTFIPAKGKRDFTLTEITDLLNEALLAQKYTLVRRPMSFTVLPADEKIDPALLPRVPLDDLGKRGKTELVTVVLQLTNVTAKDIATDVKKMLGVFGDMVVLEKANQLILQDTAFNLQQIRQMVNDLETRRRKLAGEN
jgi:RNA polymerase sigma factor (sigma-70 family)